MLLLLPLASTINHAHASISYVQVIQEYINMCRDTNLHYHAITPAHTVKLTQYVTISIFYETVEQACNTVVFDDKTESFSMS